MAAILSIRWKLRRGVADIEEAYETEVPTMFHQYAPLAAFVGLMLAIAGSAMFARKPSLLAVAMVAIGAVLTVTPYV